MDTKFRDSLLDLVLDEDVKHVVFDTCISATIHYKDGGEQKIYLNDQNRWYVPAQKSYLDSYGG